jgi:hypothetical protein
MLTLATAHCGHCPLATTTPYFNGMRVGMHSGQCWSSLAAATKIQNGMHAHPHNDTHPDTPQISPHPHTAQLLVIHHPTQHANHASQRNRSAMATTDALRGTRRCRARTAFCGPTYPQTRHRTPRRRACGACATHHHRHHRHHRHHHRPSLHPKAP